MATYQEKVKACYKKRKELTDWEKTFITDYKGKVDKYGDTTAFSDKQKACIDKIYCKIEDIDAAPADVSVADPIPADNADIFGAFEPAFEEA